MSTTDDQLGTTAPLSRDAFPVLEDFAYLDTARQGPLPEPAVLAMTSFLRSQALRPGGDHWDLIERTRAKAASLIGADPSEVAFVKNTTEGVSFVANGLPWRIGDRVLVLADEHPAISYPWRMLTTRGVRVETIPADPENGSLNLRHIRAEISQGDVRVVALSWVDWIRGERRDLRALARLCRPLGVRVCVDAIQGLGTLPLDVLHCQVDVLTASAFKGLLGPDGIGLLYVRPDLELPPTEFGKLSTPSRSAFESDPAPALNAGRFEGGHLNTPGVVAWAGSLDLILAAGDRLWPYVSRLRADALAIIDAAGGVVRSPRAPERSSAVISFDFPDRSAEEAVQFLHQHRVWCSARGGSIRLSLHGFNNHDDLRLLSRGLDLLRGVRQGGTP